MEEYFFALTIKDNKSNEVWDPITAYKDDRPHKLIIKYILLGSEVPENQVNIVQVEALTKQNFKKVPIAVLKAGEANQISLTLPFEDPVSFSLLQGDGPVHILGQHYRAEALDDTDEEETEK